MKRYIVWYYIVTTSTALPSISNPAASQTKVDQIAGYNGFRRDSATNDLSKRRLLGSQHMYKVIDSTHTK